MFIPPNGMSYEEYLDKYGAFPSDTPNIPSVVRPVPPTGDGRGGSSLVPNTLFANTLSPMGSPVPNTLVPIYFRNPDRPIAPPQMGSPGPYGQGSFGRPMLSSPYGPSSFGRPMFSSPYGQGSFGRPNPYGQGGIGSFGMFNPYGQGGMSGFGRPNPYSQGGIGSFGMFNQLASMTPDQFDTGMSRFNNLQQQFGPQMGGSFGMFNQLASMTPEQFDAGMSRFNNFQQQFGGGFPPGTTAQGNSGSGTAGMNQQASSGLF